MSCARGRCASSEETQSYPEAGCRLDLADGSITKSRLFAAFWGKSPAVAFTCSAVTIPHGEQARVLRLKFRALVACRLTCAFVARLECEVPLRRSASVVAGCGSRFFDPGGRPGPGLPGFGTPVRQGRVAWRFRSPVHRSLHRGGLEPAERLRSRPGLELAGQVQAGEMPLQRGSDGAHPACTRRIRVICVAVRARLIRGSSCWPAPRSSPVPKRQPDPTALTRIRSRCRRPARHRSPGMSPDHRDLVAISAVAGRTDLTDAQWAVLEPLLPAGPKRVRRDKAYGFGAYRRYLRRRGHRQHDSEKPIRSATATTRAPPAPAAFDREIYSQRHAVECGINGPNATAPPPATTNSRSDTKPPCTSPPSASGSPTTYETGLDLTV
jgi:transposase